jgi:diguanylate cyclase (GGDEF)-like protein/PAS domain S-box-containing protein
VDPNGITVFGGLTAAAVLSGRLTASRGGPRESAHLTPLFVVDFAALLLLGANMATLIAIAGMAARTFANPQRSTPRNRLLLNTGGVLLAIQAAGAAYAWCAAVVDPFSWPSRAIPIAGAALAYCASAGVVAEILVPLFLRQGIDRLWWRSTARAFPPYIIGASVAAGCVELVEQHAWSLAPVVAVPLYCAFRAYRLHVERLEELRRRHEIVNALEQGMAVVDDNGRITVWDEALQRILSCPGNRAIGRSLLGAVPALTKTEVPQALSDTLVHRKTRTLRNVAVPFGPATRVLDVSVVPVDGGATLLWHDVTERTHADQAVRRSEERLALAADGANDGWWEWDLRSDEFFVSLRWKTMIGLSGSIEVARADEWMQRVHAEDIKPLKETLAAYLSGRTEIFQHEHRILHEDGTYRRFLARAVAVRGANGRATRIGGSLTDTTERAIARERLRSAGFLDPLTGLCNRAVFVERLGRCLEEFKEQRGYHRFAALYLDLDRFKVVNDSLGHLVGDELLKAVSRRLESCLRPGDALARLGGDEFAILLTGLDDGQQANAIAFRIQSVLNQPFSIGGREVFTSASIGIAFGRVQYTAPDEIMRDADTAMYQAKARGKARHELFDADMHARALDRLGFENDLRHAVNQNDFEVHYQPIVSLASGMCVGFESLVRWTRNGEAVSPAIFVPIAEELGLIESLGAWVLQQACTTFADWQRRFPDGSLDFITVNVSSRQLAQHNFFRIVEQVVEDAGLKPGDLRLEITETGLMDNPNAAAALLQELRDYGVKIYLDDFGTGYSSLSHLHKLPVDALKIDRSFVRSLLLPDRPAIVESILALARTLNTSVVAEGIESEVQARELERLGCTHAQGYLFSRPLSMRAAERIIAASQPLGPKGQLSSAVVSAPIRRAS